MCAMNTITELRTTSCMARLGAIPFNDAYASHVTVRYRAETHTETSNALAAGAIANDIRGNVGTGPMRCIATAHAPTNTASAAAKRRLGDSVAACRRPQSIPSSRTVIQFESAMYATKDAAVVSSTARITISAASTATTSRGVIVMRRSTSAHTRRRWIYVPMYHVVGFAGKLSTRTFTPSTNGM